MLLTKVARRYAAALYQLADEKKKLDEVLADMQMINNTIRSSRELLVFLRNEVITDEKKQAIISEIFDKKVSGITRDFLSFLIRKNREDQLAAITEAFIQKYNQVAGILDVDVTYAYEPDDKQVKLLQSTLEKSTGKKIVLHKHHVPSIRGGLRVKIGDTVIDGSVSYKVQQLETLFSGTAV